MAKKKTKNSKRLAGNAINIDYFAEPVSLNYRGKYTFSSTTGAWISMIVRVLILGFIAT
jgi:hypothetical protein